MHSLYVGINVLPIIFFSLQLIYTDLTDRQTLEFRVDFFPPVKK